ncbi:hypothetical protein JCM8097_009577 [Rhodosporidiobolus ruineniae]
MSFSDLTRSLTTTPTPSSPAPTSRSSSSVSSLSLFTTPSSRSAASIAASVSARTGPSNIAGYSIAAGETAVASASPTGLEPGSSSAVSNESVALGVGLGLGLAALLSILAALFVVRQRRAQRASFDRRAEVIRGTMQEVERKEGRDEER